MFKAIKYGLNQNECDMLMTGEELRACRKELENYEELNEELTSWIKECRDILDVLTNRGGYEPLGIHAEGLCQTLVNQPWKLGRCYLDTIARPVRTFHARLMN